MQLRRCLGREDDRTRSPGIDGPRRFAMGFGSEFHHLFASSFHVKNRDEPKLRKRDFARFGARPILGGLRGPTTGPVKGGLNRVFGPFWGVLGVSEGVHFDDFCKF